MPCVELLESGGAVVSGVPLSPFSGWQHEAMHALALGRFATYARRAAFERGWVGQLFDDDFTCFVGSSELALAGAPVAVRPSSEGVARLSVAAVARVSFSLRCELLLQRAGEEALLLGTSQLTYVRVARSTRRAAPLDEAMRARLAAAVVAAGGGASGAALERLEAADFAGVAASLRVALRPADFDFNGHLNQGVAQGLVVDAVLGGAEQRVRRLRTDFVREVPRGGSGDAVEVASVEAESGAQKRRFVMRHGGETTAIGFVEVAEE